MADEMTDVPVESLFKSNKRRKIIRRRNADDGETESPGNAEAGLVLAQETADDGHSEASQTVRRPAARKHGIGFSSSGQPQMAKDADPGETALVPIQSGGSEEVASGDRFVKPSGKVVVEDKHLTAYVDSKLAEFRSSTATPTQDSHAGVSSISSASIDASLDGESAVNTGISPGKSSVQTYLDQRKGYSNRQPRKRRQPAARDESAVARDAMVDQIMLEGEIPIYDRTPQNEPTTGGDDFDADEAAANAFKAEFLASLQDKKRRKPPAPPPTKGAQQQQAPTGPKLGGSRSQREKMKALEEAKNAAGRK